MSLVESELGLLQVEIEGVFWHGVELDESLLCQAPEAFDAVDVVGSGGELAVSMADPEVFVEAQVDETVIPSPPSVRNTACGVALPGIMACSVAFDASGTISVKAWSPRLSSPKTMVFPLGFFRSCEPDAHITRTATVMFSINDSWDAALQLIGLPYQIHGQIFCHFKGFTLVQTTFCHQSTEEGAVNPAGYVVPGRD